MTEALFWKICGHRNWPDDKQLRDVREDFSEWLRRKYPACTDCYLHQDMRAAWEAGTKFARSSPAPSASQAEGDTPTEEMLDSVRGVLQVLRGKPGATFRDVRVHCGKLGDDIGRWPTWAAVEYGYVTERAAAAMIYEIMQRHRPSPSDSQKEDANGGKGAAVEGIERAWFEYNANRMDGDEFACLVATILQLPLPQAGASK